MTVQINSQLVIRIYLTQQLEDLLNEPLLKYIIHSLLNLIITFLLHYQL